MKEKVIIKSELDNIKKLSLIICAIGVGVGIITVIIGFNNPFYAEKDITYNLTSALPYFLACSVLPFLVVAFIVYKVLSKNSITVTDKRVYGTAIFGKRVDLPLDSISAISSSMLNGIAIATSSGNIRFLGIKNRDQIYDEISKLLLKRQDK